MNFVNHFPSILTNKNQRIFLNKEVSGCKNEIENGKIACNYI